MGENGQNVEVKSAPYTTDTTHFHPKPDLSMPALVVVLIAQARRGLWDLILLLYHRDVDQDGCGEERTENCGDRLETRGFPSLLSCPLTERPHLTPTIRRETEGRNRRASGNAIRLAISERRGTIQTEGREESRKNQGQTICSGLILDYCKVCCFI